MNKELRNQLERGQAALTSLQDQLAESEARGAVLQQHLEEASNTIFRLRPQRQECTESEIEEDYRKLISLVKNWVNANCESFLDDDLIGFDAIRSRRIGADAHPETFEAITLQFQSKFNHWIEAKEHVLVAAVMRYLFDRILDQCFSVLLRSEERDFLVTIQNSMENMDLQKDLLTIRNWRSDTVTAVNSHESFTKRYPMILQELTKELYNFLQGALPAEHGESIMSSLYKDVIGPALALAQKTQSAPTIWAFRYSDYSNYQPGEFGSRLPNFLNNIKDYRCINMSNRGKRLKPATDLATKEQQENLVYVLDISPGLYCQRVTAGDSPSVSTISQPVLLVIFAANDAHMNTQHDISEPANSETVDQNPKPLPARPDSKSRVLVKTAKRIFG